MKIIIELSEREIKTLEEQVGLSIKNKEDAVYLIHELLKALKDW